MALRNILYIDSSMIDNYMSQIDGYIYEEATIVSSSNNEKKGKIGVSAIGIEGHVQGESTETTQKTTKITEASKLDKVIKYLEKEDELKCYEGINSDSWNEISRNDFLEILVKPRLTRIEELSEAAKSIKNLVNVIQPYTDTKMIDNKVKDALNGIESLSKIKNANTITCVFNFEDNEYPAVAYLDESCLKVPIEKVTQQSSYLLCKVQRKIPKGESIELDELFEGLKSIATNRSQRRKMPSNLSNPDVIKDKVKGPAFVVIPIAIYQ